MNVALLFSRQWCDIVFEHRNKAYGAYILRQQTPRRYAWAFGWTLGLILLFVGVCIFVNCMQKPPTKKADFHIKDIARFEGVKIKEAIKVKPPQEVTPPILTEKKVVDVSVEEPIALDLPSEKEDIPPEIIDIHLDELEGLTAEDIGLEKAVEGQQTEGVVVDSIPRYPKGLANFMKWLHGMMRYPYICERNHVAGHVLVSFIVEADGRIGEIKILESDAPEFSGEVRRVLHRMDPWIPAQKNGKPIRSQVTLPVEFQLNEQPFS